MIRPEPVVSSVIPFVSLVMNQQPLAARNWKAGQLKRGLAYTSGWGGAVMTTTLSFSR